MDEIGKTIDAIVRLLPGFITLAVALYVADLGEYSEFQQVLFAVGMTFVDNLLAAWTMVLWLRLSRCDWTSRIDPETPRVGVVMLVAVASGLVLGPLLESDWLHAAVRTTLGAAHFEKVSSRPLLTWVASIADRTDLRTDRLPDDRQAAPLMFAHGIPNRWVRMSLADPNQVVEGRIALISGSSETFKLYLSPACRIDGDRATLIPGPGLVTGSDHIGTLEILDEDASPCFCQDTLLRQHAAAADPLIWHLAGKTIPGTCR